MESIDVTVIGGGPAGSTIARLLAEWGYSVTLLSSPQGRRSTLAESIPPSTRKLFAFLGVLHHLDAAGFYRSSGNTVWWGRGRPRVEHFDVPPEARGYQVLRADFDRLLLDLAETAGVRVLHDSTVRRVSFFNEGPVQSEYADQEGTMRRVASRFVIDASGRAGVIARQGLRKEEAYYSTLAIAAAWQSEWQLEDETHTLVETYDDGWAWSVPLSSQARHFTFMVNPSDWRERRSAGIEEFYRAELDKTFQFKRVLSGARLQSLPWSCDASLYFADRYAGDRFLLVGDAASFIDPLSSFGVKKALASAWVGAVVANTCLVRPEMRDAALEYHSNRERQVYASYLRQSALYFREASLHHPRPFWTERARVPVDPSPWEADEEELKRDPDVIAAFEALKSSLSIRLRRRSDVRVERRAGIRGREILLEKAIVSPGLPYGVRFLGGVNLPSLLEIAGEHGQVPDLFEDYNRRCPPVEMGNFLGALSVLLAKGILDNVKP